jgi:hypothetical protein
LPARECPRLLISALFEDREGVVGDRQRRIGQTRVRDRHPQVLLDGQLREDPAVLGDPADAAVGDLVGPQAVEVLAAVADGPFPGRRQS